MDDETRDRIAFNLSVFAVPVIPGPGEIRRPPAAGEPGHLERLASAPPLGIWPITDRARDLTG